MSDGGSGAAAPRVDARDVAFGVLGPLTVAHPSGPVMMGGRSERAVLARLLLVPGAPVSIDELVEGLWRHTPPPTAERTLQSYLSRWRSRLRPVELRRTGTGSYVLDVSDSRVDATDFRALLAAARRSASGDPRRAIEHYDDALRLWRGAPFAELEDWASVAPVVRGLDELRSSALEERIQLRLTLGEHASLVADLELLVDAEPLRERRWAQLMVALARSGRHTEALRAFQRARHVLAEESGLDPGPELVELERRIVARDPTIVGPSADGRAPQAGDVAERPSARLVGRERERRELDRAVRAAVAGHGGTWLVTGPRGVGKTRLVSDVVDQARQRDLRVVWGRCWPHGDAPPYWPWSAVLGELASEPVPDTAAGDRFSFVHAAFERVVAAASRRPLVVVLDDLHAADDGARFLAGYLARASVGLPLVLIATAVSTADGEPPVEVDVSATSVLHLHGLVPDAVAELARDLGRDIDDETAAALAALTAGVPARLHRALLAADAAGANDHDLVGAAADQALGDLARATRLALARLALVGPTVDHRDALAALGHDGAVLAATVEAATAAGIVRSAAGGAIVFVHPRSREAVLAAIEPDERLDATVAVRDALGSSSRPDALVRRAELALDAAARSPDDAAIAIAVVRDAVQHLRAPFRHRDAAALLDRAVTTVGGSAPSLVSTALLGERADAALLAGRLGDQRRWAQEFLTAAERDGDAIALARAALAASGFWVEDVRDALDKQRVLAAQRRALDGLATDTRPEARDLALRLRVRLAAQEVDWFGADRGGLDAVVDEARRCADAVVRCEAVGLAANCTLAPAHSERRRALADELVALATAAGQPTYAVWGLAIATAERFKQVDPTALRQLRLLVAHADAIDNASLRYVAGVMQTMTLIREGRLDEADAAVEACLAQGAGEAGDPDAFIYYGAHLVILRWLQGREDETLALFRSVVDSPDLATTDLTAVSACAALASRSGATDMARVYFDRLVRDGLGSLRQSSNFLAMLVGVIEAACHLGETDAAREAHELLLPYADGPIMPSLAVVCFGSARRWLGLAAATFGDLDAAVDHLERAVADNLRFGNVPVAHICRVDLATVLSARRAPGDMAAAVDLVRTAAAGADALGMTVLAGRWRDALGEAPLVTT